MAASFKLICDVSDADTVEVSRNEDEKGVCFGVVFGNRQEGGSIFVKNDEARALAHFLLSIAE